MVIQGVTLNTLFRRLEKLALKITREAVYDVRLYRNLLRQVHSLHVTCLSYKEIFDFVKPIINFNASQAIFMSAGMGAWNSE